MSNVEQKMNQNLSRNIDTNVKVIQSLLKQNDDVVERTFYLPNQQGNKGTLFYVEGIVDTDKIERALKDLMYTSSANSNAVQTTSTESNLAMSIQTHMSHNSSVKVANTLQEGINGILLGDCFCIIDQSEQGLIFSGKGGEKRSVEEPMAEQVVRGPRDGFTEDIRTNTALVRRRIRDVHLKVEGLELGTKTKTTINVSYINGIVKESLVEEVKQRLNKIEIDGILESNYIEEMIRDAPYSPFSTVLNTERPDKVAAALLEGRVAIFVDNTPFVLVVPAHFWDFLQASDDYYLNFLTGTFIRWVRYIAFIISLTIPSIYVLLTSFHQEMIPTALALTIASGREVIPFPVLFEALVMEIIFELMREAGLRMPKPIGQAVSIVGSLIIGQAAVQAGIVSPFMVIIVALTGISSFSIPNFSASYSIRLIRFPLLIASGTLGLLGFIGMFFLLAIHAVSIRSFGESYLAPATPFKPKDQKDLLIRFPWWHMKNRPELAADNGIREANEKPAPPDKGNSETASNKISDEMNSDANTTSTANKKDASVQRKKSKRIKRKTVKLKDLMKDKNDEDQKSQDNE
ncbi:spore germination protein [Aquibacillus sediminis]|uniref:spore germination protein n=1 Tax=Aquibacillus sediminis TaxID=2574734 RepID=UPI0011087810|nr:spore germination protein [Aquibacillus sediminis]